MGSIKHKKIQSISSIFNHVSISLGLVAWDLQWKTRLISIVPNPIKIVVVVVVIVAKILSRSVTAEIFLIWANVIRRNVARTMSP